MFGESGPISVESFSTLENFGSSAGGGQFTIPDAELLFHGDFKRAGDDLKIVGQDGRTFVVHDYFKSDKLPTLFAPDGAALTGDIVAALAGPRAPGQYAQATAPQSDATPIGRVATVQGGATAVRNGVAITLNVGDAVLKGDVVQTQGDSAVGIIFGDGTTFNLGANARMVLNDFVYNPAPGSANSALINLVQGSITFIAGEVAKHGDMKVGTPVATMGIRGTAVKVDIDVNNGTTKAQVLIEPGGHVGEFNIYSLSGQLIGTVNNAGTQTTITPSGPLDAVASVLALTPDQVQQAFVAVQNAFQTQAIGQAILATQPIPPSPQGPQGPAQPQNQQGPDNQSPQNPTQNTPHTQIGSTDVSTTTIKIDANESNGTTTTQTTIITPPDNTPPTIPINLTPPPPPPPPPPAAPPVNLPAFFETGSADSVVHVANTAQPVQKSGTLLFTDATGDSHTVTVTPRDGNVGALAASLSQDTTTTTEGGVAYTYTAPAGQNHVDVFDVTVKDDGGNSTTTTISFNLEEHPPVATDVATAVTEAQIAGATANARVYLPNILNNVTDPDGDVVTITAISAPTVTETDHGLQILAVNAETAGAGEVARYDIHTNFGDAHIAVGVNGQLSLWSDGGEDPFEALGVGQSATINFSYTVDDGFGGTDTKNVAITVNGSDNPPSAANDTFFANESQIAAASAGAPRFVGSVLFNDHDVDGIDTLTVTGISNVSVSEHDFGLSILSITPTTAGSGEVARYDIQTNYGDAFVSVGSNGHVHVWSDSGEDPFKPLGVGQSATINFTYTVDDGNGGTDTAHAAIVVDGTNDRPTAVSDSFTATESEIQHASSFFKAHIGNVFANDSDVDGDFLAVVGITAPTVSESSLGLQISSVTSETKGFGEVARYDIKTNSGDAHLAVDSDGKVYLWSDSGEDPFRGLGVGESATINFNYTIGDGHGGFDTAQASILVSGTNDPAFIFGDKSGSVTEAGGIDNATPGAPAATGTLSDNDFDNASNTFQAVTAPTASANAYGTYTIDASGNWAYTLDDTNAAVQALNVGDTLTDTFVIRTQDGTAQTVSITIQGANDTAVISGPASGAVTKAGDAGPGVPAVSGTLTDADIDNPANTFQAVAPGAASDNHLGTYAMTADGTWTYTLDNSNAVVLALNGGATTTDSFTVYTEDGTAQTVTITVNGTNTPAVVSGTIGGSVTEAGGVNNATPGVPTVSGTLTDTDVDNPANTFQPVAAGAASDNHFGTYAMAADGTWTYTLDNTNATVQALGAGATATDSFTVHTIDGTAQTISITINGANDAAVLSSAVVDLNETNAPLTTGGTLTVSDVDSPATFVAQANTAGSYGQFSIGTNGVWSYTANSAFDSLNVGQSVGDTFQVFSADGTATSVQVTIHGTNDAAVLSSAVVDLNETNAPLTTGGSLTASDVDSPATFIAQSNTAGTYGQFSIGTDGVWSYTANSAFDNLNIGQSVSDTFQVFSADGTATSVQVTIHGTNDAAVLSSAAVDLNETNAPLTTGGTLTISDVDSPATFVAQSNTAGTYGHFSIGTDGVWSYTANSALDSLNVGQSVSDTFQVTSADGTQTSVQVTIHGTNDAAQMSSETVLLNESNAPLTANGALTISDVDSPATFQTQTNTAGSYGHFSIDATGAWTYTANSAFDSLNVGDTLTDTFQVLSADNTPTSVTVKILGTNDAAVLSSAVVDLNETNAPLTTGGTLTISDVDSPATFVAQSNTAGTNGHFSIDTAGVWTYTANSAFDNLNVGQSVSDTFQVLSADGTATSVQVTIHGTNDAAVLSSAAVDLNETNAPLTAGGTLTISDVDSPATFVAQSNTAGTYGHFSIGTDGVWSYTANSALDSLNVGQSVSDTFQVASADGTQTSVQVTIHGTNDAAQMSSETVLLNESNAPLTANGALTISDVDSPATFQSQTNTAGSYGHFSIDATGAWTYTANSAFDSLNVGDTLTDTFQVLSADNTPSSVTVKILGTNDAAVLSSAVVDLNETNAPLTTGGTLTISDVDSPATFVAQSYTAGTNGHFSIDTAGVWSYTANSAFNNLNVGQSVSDTFQVLSADGTATSVQVTIHGTNDAAVLSSAVVDLNETNAPLTTGGTLTISDVDSPATFVAQSNVAGSNGHFSIDTSGVWSYTANSAFDSLNVGQSVSDTFQVSSADGTQTSVTVNIHGTNDAAVLSSATVNIDETNAPLTTGGTLTVSDIDSPATFVAQSNVAGTNGHFSINASGVWSYTANSAFDSLNVGQSVSDTFQVFSADGTQTSVTVNIHGTNDAAVLSSATVNLDETNAPLTTGGTLTISDVDSPASFVAQSNVAGTNGHFSIDASGVWSYTANSAFDSLNVGQSVSDTFQVLSADGTATSVQVTIHGTNDAAVLSSAVVDLNETNAPLTTGGTLTISDVDSPATFVAQTNVAGTNGHFSINAAGAWSYTANSAFDNLNVGQSVSDTFQVFSADGTATSVQVSIHGTNDAAVISGVAGGSVTEAGGVNNATPGSATVGGTLTDTDVDNVANTFQAVSTAAPSINGYGTYTVDASGHWNYALDNNNAAVQALNNGQQLTDTFSVLTQDGTPQSVAITINGANDAAVISGTAIGSVTAAGTDNGGEPTAAGTLTDADVDNAANTFQAVTTAAASSNGYGTYTVDASGHWNYTLDNTNTAVQSLGTSDTLTDSFAVLTQDGTAQTIVITVHGTDHAPTLAAVSGPTYSDTAAADHFSPASGTLYGSDIDSGSSLTYGIAGGVADNSLGGYDTSKAGGYGTLYVNSATGAYSFVPNDAAINALPPSTATDNFTVTVSDGSLSTTQPFTVTLNGANDSATVAGDVSGSVTEAGGVNNATPGTPTATGALTDTDVDNPANTFQPVATATAGANGYGTYTVDASGHWSYTLDNNNAAVQALNTGSAPLTDTFTVLTQDGTAQVVTISIHGANDAAVLSSAAVDLNETNAPLTTGGTLTISDVDSPASFVAQNNVAGNRGHFSIDASGVWTYTANSAFDSLNVGQSVSDTFQVFSTDGTATSVQVTIHGTNDPAVLSSANVDLDETNAPLTTGGRLTATDVDSPTTFVAQTNVAGANGNFSINVAGVWTYTANSAFDNLNVGQSVSDTFQVTSFDGTQTSVQVTIHGTNDAAVLSSAVVDLNETNAPLTTGGTLTISDVDSPATFVAQSNTAGTYGHFSIGTDGAWSYTANSAHDEFAAGQTYSDVFNVASADGTQTSVTVNIHGTNDAAVLSSAVVDLNETNAPLTTGGTLTISDVDSPATFVAQSNVAGSNGHFSIDASGVWSYTANSAFDSLNVGQSVSDTFQVSSADGTQTSVQVTIHGTNDAAVLSSAVVDLNETNAPLTTGGTLTISDVDSPATFVAQTNVAGTNGHFSINTAGVWSFTANSAFDNLNVGQSVSDTFQVFSADGTQTSVQVTIHGTNDAAVLSSATVDLNETNAPLTTGGTLTVSDVDSPATFVAQSNAAGTNGHFSIDASGVWSYTANSAFDNLNVGQSVSDTFQVFSADGTQTSVQVTIHGTNDAAVISGATSGSVTEAGGVNNNLAGTPTATGTLTDTDVDNVANTFQAVSTAAPSINGYGTYTVDASGHWSYTLDDNNAAVQSLNSGQQLADTFNVLTQDGTSQPVTITIHGTNDAPVLTLPGTNVSSDENTPLVLNGASVSDPDSGDIITLNLSAVNGTLTPVDTTLPAGVTADSSPPGTLQVHGSAAAINQLLNDGVTYQPNSNFAGSDMVTVSVHDSAGATDTKSVAIDVGDTASLSVNVSVVGNYLVQEGQQLQGAATITGDSADMAQPITYQWQSSSDNGQSWTDISGATVTGADSYYQLLEGDEGKQFRVEASFTNHAGQLVTATSAPTETVADITPTITLPFTFAVDEFSVSKNGSVNFDDTFDQAPPFAPTILSNGVPTPINFLTYGSTWTDSNGKGILSSSGAIDSGESYNHVFARLTQNTDPGSTKGLKQGGVFAVSATFDLAAPGVRTGYGIELTDENATQANDQNIWLQVENTNGTVDVGLYQNGSLIASQALNASVFSTYTQIELDLTHSVAGSTSIAGSFALLGNGSPVVTTFAQNGTIFTSGVNWTRGEIYAFGAAGVAITGVAQEGQTLTALAATNDSDATLHYQWQESSDGGSTWNPIAGAADSATYVVQQSDTGDNIRVHVYTTDPDNSQSATADSAMTAQVGSANHAPVIALAPVVTEVPIPNPLPAGTDAAAANEIAPAISQDGRWVAFFSSETLPDSGGGNITSGDVYLYDRLTGTTTVLSDDAHVGSHPPVETFGNGLVSISADGGTVVFRDQTDTGNGTVHNLWVYDRASDTTHLLANPNDGDAPYTIEDNAQINGAGNLIVFNSTDFGDNTSAPVRHIYVTDLDGNIQTDITMANLGITEPSDPSQPQTNFQQPDISGGGRYLTFWTQAATSDANSTPVGDATLYTYDRMTGAATAIATTSSADDGWPASMSNDGRYVVFQSDSDALDVQVGGTANGKMDIFVFDRTLNTITGVTDNATVVSDGDSARAAISGNGRYIVLASDADNLVAGDANGQGDTFVYDTQAHTFQIISVAADGTQGDAESILGADLSSGGTFDTFGSTASNLVTPSDNDGGQSDIFTFDRSGGVFGAVTENDTTAAIAGNLPPNTLSTHGAFNFTDADTGDQHTVSVINVSVDTSGAPAGFPTDQLGTFTPTVVETPGSGVGEVAWTFTVDNGLVQGLNAFQNVKETYTVQLSDGHGGVTTQNVSISIFGTGDAPMLTLPGNSVATFSGTSISLSGAHVSDADMGDIITLNLSVAHGSLTSNVDPTSLGITVDDGNGADGTLRVHGPTAAIDTLLNDGVTYTPNAGSPDDALTVSVRDSKGLLDFGSVTITNHSGTALDVADGTLSGTAPGDQITFSPWDTQTGTFTTGSGATPQADWHLTVSNDALIASAGSTEIYNVQDQTNPGANQRLSVSIGGPGQDQFQFNSGDGTRALVNFSTQSDPSGHYIGDTITLGGFSNGGHDLALADVLADLTTDTHGNAVVNLGNGDSVVFEHVSQSVVQAQAGNLFHFTQSLG